MPSETVASFFDLLKPADERRQVSAHSDGVCEVGDLLLERCQLGVDHGAWIRLVWLEEFTHSDDHFIGQARR